MSIPLHRHFGGAPYQAPGDEKVVDRDDEEGNDIEDKERGHGVDLWVQVPSLWIGGASHDGVIGVGDGERVQVRKDGLWDGQGHGQHPDHGGAKADFGVRRLYVHWPDDSFVSVKTLQVGLISFLLQHK